MRCSILKDFHFAYFSCFHMLNVRLTRTRLCVCVSERICDQTKFSVFDFQAMPYAHIILFIRILSSALKQIYHPPPHFMSIPFPTSCFHNQHMHRLGHAVLLMPQNLHSFWDITTRIHKITQPKTHTHREREGMGRKRERKRQYGWYITFHIRSLCDDQATNWNRNLIELFLVATVEFDLLILNHCMYAS